MHDRLTIDEEQIQNIIRMQNDIRIEDCDPLWGPTGTAEVYIAHELVKLVALGSAVIVKLQQRRKDANRKVVWKRIAVDLGWRSRCRKRSCRSSSSSS